MNSRPREPQWCAGCQALRDAPCPRCRRCSKHCTCRTDHSVTPHKPVIAPLPPVDLRRYEDRSPLRNQTPDQRRAAIEAAKREIQAIAEGDHEASISE